MAGDGEEMEDATVEPSEAFGVEFRRRRRARAHLGMQSRHQLLKDGATEVEPGPKGDTRGCEGWERIEKQVHMSKPIKRVRLPPNALFS